MKPLAMLPILFAAQLAQAEVCVSIAEDRDTLNETDRAGVLLLARSSFEEAGEKVVDAPCAAEYKLANARLGESVTATISGPKGSRRGQSRTIEDLGNVYDQMIRSLVTGKAVEDSVTRSNATEAQANPHRIKADSLWLARIGTGFVGGSDPSKVPIGLGVGYRYELDRFAVETGMDLTVSPSDKSADTSGFHFGFFVGGLYFFDPQESSSPYVGLALGYGGAGLTNNDETHSGAGLEGRVSAGYALLRSSTIRIVVELEATLPFYSLERDDFLSDDGSDSKDNATKYAPIFGLSLGVGY